jgi:hypothetical protein
MTKVNGYLVTVTEVKTMLPLKGTPADSNKIVTKQDVLDNFYVDVDAQPFASYTSNRCPRYEDLINPCTYGFGTTIPTVTCTSYSGATVSFGVTSTSGYYQVALVNASTLALITSWQYRTGAGFSSFTFTNVPNGNFKIATASQSSPDYCITYSNTYTVDCAVSLKLTKTASSSVITYGAFFEYYILVNTNYGSTGNSPGQTIVIEDQLDTLKLSMTSLMGVYYNGTNVTGDGSYCTIISNNSPTGYFKIELLKPVDATTNSYIIALSAFPTITNGTINNTAYTYFPLPISPILTSSVTVTVNCTLENYYQLSSCSGGATAYTKVVPSGGGQRYVLFSTFPYSYYTYTGAILQLCEPPSGYNSNIQIVSGQTGCP